MALTNLPIPFTQMPAVSPVGVPLVDFTGIPTGVKRITISIDKLQSTGASHLLAQLIVGGVPVASGYQSNFGIIVNATNSQSSGTPFGFGSWSANAVDQPSGIMTLVNMGNNIWTYSTSGGLTNGSSVFGISGGGYINLAGPLTGIRMTNISALNFTSGSVGISYE